MKELSSLSLSRYRSLPLFCSSFILSTAPATTIASKLCFVGALNYGQIGFMFTVTKLAIYTMPRISPIRMRHESLAAISCNYFSLPGRAL